MEAGKYTADHNGHGVFLLEYQGRPGCFVYIRITIIEAGGPHDVTRLYTSIDYVVEFIRTSTVADSIAHINDVAVDEASVILNAFYGGT